MQTDANGLLHMRARYYSTDLRRFINADPIGFAGGMNWYAYAGGNPIMLADPSGLDWEGTTLFTGVGGNAALLLGIEGSFAISVSFGDNLSEWDIGLQSNLGGNLGVNLGADAHVGVVSGSLRDQEGGYRSTFGNVGPVSGTLTDNDVNFKNILPQSDDGKFDGGALGLGIGWPVGYGVSAGVTDVVSAQGVILGIRKWIKDRFGDDKISDLGSAPEFTMILENGETQKIK